MMEQLWEEAQRLAAASSPRLLGGIKTRRALRCGPLTLLAVAMILTGYLATLALAASPRNAIPIDPNSMLLPPLTPNGRIKVTIALHVLNLSMISEVTERFQLTGYLLAQWYDPRLIYQATGPNDTHRMIAPDSVWRPQLVIINVIEPRRIDETSLQVAPDGLVSYVERFDALLTSTFHLKAFPFDTQKLEVIIHPFTSQQQSIVFVPSQLSVWTATEFNTYSSLESWRFESLTFNLSSAASQLGMHAISEARFEITVERRYGFYLWKVFLPLLLMVIMSWSVFWFDPPEASSQVTIAVTTILTIIAFALAISLTLPRVPYLTFADAFFLTCYVFAFVTMVEVTMVHITYRSGRHTLTAKIRRTARWLVPAAFVVTNLIVIMHFLA
jgi:Neurotransmitter-gated ion-channel ligand binding domain/Neurotransmitter-gated ion-channel transmembrane region